MTDTLLADAIAAARAVADDNADDGAATRLRIRDSLAKRGSRKKLWTLLVAALGTMFASTAFALQAGWEPPWSPKSAVAIPSAPDPEPVAVRTSAVRGTAPPPALAITYEAMPPLPVKQSVEQGTLFTKYPSDPEPSEITEPAGTEQTSPPPDTVVLVTPPAPDAELVAYRAAHTAHFKGGDRVAALAAWDALLAQFPTGKLAPEARYNRALVLIKLARFAEARAALAPFASAPAGAYRQREAAQLLDAIRDR